MGFISDDEKNIQEKLGANNYEIIVIADENENEHELYFQKLTKFKKLRNLYSRFTNLQAADKFYESGELLMKSLYIGGAGENFLENKDAPLYSAAAMTCNQLAQSMGSGKLRRG